MNAISIVSSVPSVLETCATREAEAETELPVMLDHGSQACPVDEVNKSGFVMGSVI
jgi:hypothetical protein